MYSSLLKQLNLVSMLSCGSSQVMIINCREASECFSTKYYIPDLWSKSLLNLSHRKQKKPKQSYADMPAESAGVMLGQIRLVIAVQFKY